MMTIPFEIDTPVSLPPLVLSIESDSLFQYMLVMRNRKHNGQGRGRRVNTALDWNTHKDENNARDGLEIFFCSSKWR